MSIREEIYESLPYIDPEPTDAESAAASALISASLPDSRPPHPSLPPSTAPSFSPAITTLLDTPTKLTAIDTTRYQPQSTLDPSSSLDETTSALHQAYASSAHLSTRSLNLSLLSTHGKNAWLMSNFQAENILAGLERELAERKGEVDRLAIERRRAQEGVAGEMRGLEEAWRSGVGSALETEVAVEGLRAEIRERLRAGAAGA